jgi:hypothetical protein
MTQWKGKVIDSPACCPSTHFAFYLIRPYNKGKSNRTGYYPDRRKLCTINTSRATDEDVRVRISHAPGHQVRIDKIVNDNVVMQIFNACNDLYLKMIGIKTHVPHCVWNVYQTCLALGKSFDSLPVQDIFAPLRSQFPRATLVMGSITEKQRLCVKEAATAPFGGSSSKPLLVPARPTFCESISIHCTDPGISGHALFITILAYSGFSHPGFSHPGFSHPGFSHPGFSHPGCSHSGFSHPGFSHSGFSHSGFSHPGFSHSGFSHPGFSHPGFSHSDLDSQHDVTVNKLIACRSPYILTVSSCAQGLSQLILSR